MELSSCKSLIQSLKELKTGAKSKLEERVRQVKEIEIEAKKKVKNHYFDLRMTLDELESQIVRNIEI